MPSAPSRPPFGSRSRPASHATGDSTRARLIDAATEVFIEEGFKAARVQAIAEQAGVRLSAINYHFGSKAGLYLAVLQHHAEAALAHAPLLPEDPAAPLRERFEFFVKGMLTRLLDPHSHSRIAWLAVRELTSPTAALDEMFGSFVLPQAQIGLALIAEILGPRAAPIDCLRAMASVAGQALAYRVAQPLIERLQPGLYDSPELVGQLTRHIAEFSWAGLQAQAARLPPQQGTQA